MRPTRAGLPVPDRTILRLAGRNGDDVLTAVSRAIDVLVRAGLIDRQSDPDNRRRLALTLTEAGREQLNRPPVSDSSLEGRIGKLAHSEQRALERGIEILERLPR